jgi:exodeoxyribonuclease III
MKIITLNLNGIRSAHSKGAFDWLREQNAEIILLQEVRALEHQLPDLQLPGYHAFWNPAEKPGYSGVGVLSKLEPKKVVHGIGSSEFDTEGRTLRLDFADFSAMSVYVPSGSSSEDRQAAKMRFLADFQVHLSGLKKKCELIVGGDFNIAHQKIDLKNWQSNQKSSGFLPEDRAWVDGLLESGFKDSFRDHVGQETAAYSWWSNRGGARGNNVGWRLDYQFCTPKLAARVNHASIYRETFFSDHAPVILDYGLE